MTSFEWARLPVAALLALCCLTWAQGGSEYDPLDDILPSSEHEGTIPSTATMKEHRHAILLLRDRIKMQKGSLDRLRDQQASLQREIKRVGDEVHDVLNVQLDGMVEERPRRILQRNIEPIVQAALEKRLALFQAPQADAARCFPAPAPLPPYVGKGVPPPRDGGTATHSDASHPTTPATGTPTEPPTAPPGPDTLHAAAARDDVDALIRIFAVNSSTDARDAHGDTALHAAASGEKLQAMEQLMYWGADPRTRGRLLRSPLHSAAAHGQLPAAQRLVLGGAQLDARDARGDTAAAVAARANHSAVLHYLLLEDPSAAYVDARGDSALLGAVRSGRWEWALRLAQRGAPATARGRDGATPLLLAARDGRLDLLRAMLRHSQLCNANEVRRALEAARGAEEVWALAQAAPELVAGAAGRAALRQAAADGRCEALTALYAAVASPRGNDEAVDIALLFALETGSGGCAVSLLRRLGSVGNREHLLKRALALTNSSQVTLLVRDEFPDLLRGAAGGEALVQAAEGGRCAAVEGLLEAGADSKWRDSAGRTALEVAALRGHAQCVPPLRAREGPLKRTKWQTALLEAARDGRLNEVVALIAAGVERDAKDTAGRTGLSIAAEKGHVHVVTEMLRQGATKDTNDTKGYTPLIYASVGNHLSVVRALVAAGAQLEFKAEDGDTALSKAAISGHVDIVNVLLERGANKESKNNIDRTPLMHAASNGRAVALRVLLRAGANIEPKDIWETGALSIAATSGRVGIVRQLLEGGADKESTDYFGRSALLHAANYGYDEVVRVLLNAGANMDARDRNGEASLHLAATGGHTAVVKDLLAQGANKEAKSNSGRTPLMRAASHGRLDVVRVLLAAGASVDAVDIRGETAYDVAQSDPVRRALRPRGSSQRQR